MRPSNESRLKEYNPIIRSRQAPIQENPLIFDSQAMPAKPA
jgi:hypothetical protein